jgi:hypothetical protein
MKRIVFLLLFLPTCIQIKAQNPFVGTWESYKIILRDKKLNMDMVDTSGFRSEIDFNADMTYQMTTNGEVNQGKYEFKPNKLVLFEKKPNGAWAQTWSIRWPKNSGDPFPITEEIDIAYPHPFKLKKPVGKYHFTEVDVCYRKK